MGRRGRPPKRPETIDEFVDELTSVSVVKRGRGRPEKFDMDDIVPPMKRKRGRPRKRVGLV